MLNQDPTQRWRADQLLEHPFLNEAINTTNSSQANSAGAAAGAAAAAAAAAGAGAGDGGGVPVVEKDQEVAQALRLAETKQGEL